MAEVTIGEGVSELFPLAFYYYHLEGPMNTRMDFESFESFTEFLKAEAGFFNVYRAGDRVVVEKYIRDLGVFSIFQSEKVRR